MISDLIDGPQCGLLFELASNTMAFEINPINPGPWLLVSGSWSLVAYPVVLIAVTA